MSEKYLLDTHALLFALYEPERLSQKARRAIEDPLSHLFVSSASAWEIATKHRLGKLTEYDLNIQVLLTDYRGQLRRLGASDLPIESPHALLAESFEAPHKDPFDRILAAQAKLENLVVISKDPALDAFGILRLW